MNEYLSVIGILTPVLREGHTLDAGRDPASSPLARHIAYGILRHYYHLNAIVSQLVTKPLADKHLDVHILLLAGLYSVDHIKRPQYTSVNAVVGTADELQKPWAKGILNGVLRNYLRNKERITTSVPPDAMTNHPAWLIEAIRTAWPDDAEAIFSANNDRAPMTLRVNLQKSTVDAYRQQLLQSGISSRVGNLAPTAVYLDQPFDAEALPGFADGFASVQDEASQLAATLLAPSAGDHVLDACAAPGGKTCHLLEFEPGIHLMAVDSDRGRMRQVEQNLDRIGMKCTLIVNDIGNWQTSERFDRILLDAPCSATGIIRRHPDIKLLRRHTDIDKLASTQIALLHRAWQLLKPGGVLVYATCSILPAENEGAIGQFSQEYADAVVVPIDEDWGYPVGVGRQLLPVNNSHDGFYYARLSKRA
jgi:16S rRNA (cytosine967-C5)-methyltransferase